MAKCKPMAGPKRPPHGAGNPPANPKSMPKPYTKGNPVKR